MGSRNYFLMKIERNNFQISERKYILLVKLG